MTTEEFNSHSYWSHARSSSSMWDAEGLVEVEMRYVRPDVSWPAQTHLGVHVGTIKVHLCEGKTGVCMCVSVFVFFFMEEEEAGQGTPPLKKK